MPTQALVYGHLGLGDIINTIGMIRYFRTIYDRVTVVIPTAHFKNANSFFSDDPQIDFYLIKDQSEIHPLLGCSQEKLATIINGYDLKFSGLASLIVTKEEKYNDVWAPLCFYEDVKIDPYYFWKYFKIPTSSNSQELYDIIKNSDFADNYIVTHSTCSEGKVFDISTVEQVLHVDRNKTLIIDLNTNIYDESHPLHALAAKFINKPLIDLPDLISNAQAVILSDSSIYCLAIHLPIKTSKCYYTFRDNTERNDNFSFLYNFDELEMPGAPPIKRFKLLPKPPAPIVKYY
jgi:hypothetical protein